MRFAHSRNELLRAQSQIDQWKSSFEVFDRSRYANPDWRNVQKRNWVDQKRPFLVKKADEKLIANSQISPKRRIV